MHEPLNLVLFSGTEDRLQAAAVLAAGAAAVGKPVNIFLQYWALDAFSKAKIRSLIANSSRPTSVSCSPPRFRCTSSTPYEDSSWRNWMVTVGWLTWSICAARVTLPAQATAWKDRS